MTIIWCMVPEIWSATDRIFCRFGPFLPFYPLTTQKAKFWKNEKNCLRYYHFTYVYYKWQSYDKWFLKDVAQHTQFSVILDYFFPFKNEIKDLKISFYTCVLKMMYGMIIWCMVPEMWSMTERIFWHYGPIFALLPPLTTRKIKILKNWKKDLAISF